MKEHSSPVYAPLVSVLIPAFNRVALIEYTIESVLPQDSRIEVIVVDDGSTDGTFDVLKRLQANGYIRVLTHDGRVNKVRSASLNVGLRAARGEYICILDSHDLFLPGKITKQVGFLEQNPGLGLVYGMGEAVDEVSNWLFDIHSEDHTEPNDPNAVLLDCYFLLPQNSMVWRPVYEQVGEFEETLRAAHDHDMLVKIAEVTNCAFIPVKLFQYRRHSDSISNLGGEQRWRNGFRILERAVARYPYRRSTLRERRAILHFRMAQVHWSKVHRYRTAVRLLLSGSKDPVRAIRVLTMREPVRYSQVTRRVAANDPN